MNRADRRDLIKSGASKENVDKLSMYNSPCTIVEATQIARGVSEDVVAEYNNQTRPVQVSMALQIEIMKKAIIDAGLITESKFRELYMEAVQDFNKRQSDSVESDSTTKMDVSANDVDIKVMK